MKAKLHFYSFSVVTMVVVMSIFTSACSSSSSSTSSKIPDSTPTINTSITSPFTTSTPTNPSTTPSSSDTTFQSLASAGQTVYTSSCTVCHGANGQGGVGPALWGSRFVVGEYNGKKLFDNNAQAMLSFIAKSMPFSAPGSLIHEQYVDVLCYLLIQGNEVTPSTIFDESQLSSITLK